jgi:hypothetical protein
MHCYRYVIVPTRNSGKYYCGKKTEEAAAASLRFDRSVSFRLAGIANQLHHGGHQSYRYFYFLPVTGVTRLSLQKRRRPS